MAGPGGPPGPWPPPARPRHPNATAVLVLGILGASVLPVLCSIPAWVLGGRARRDLAADPRLGGETEIAIGWVLGIVATVVSLVVLALLLLLLVVVGVALTGAGGLFGSLERATSPR